MTDTPTYWATTDELRFIPAADYIARRRRGTTGARVSRCGVCGQWTWDGRCSLHPDARQATY